MVSNFIVFRYWKYRSNQDIAAHRRHTHRMKEAAARIKINKLLEAAGWLSSQPKVR